MTRKIREQRRSAKRPDRTAAPAHLCDVRTLLVLLLAVAAGIIAGREGGWPAGLTVGIATAVALHTLLRR
jgi:hypothetical protein